MTELLKQGLCHPMHVTDQVLSIFAGTRGHLDKIPIKDVHAWESGFLEFMHSQKQPLWQKITDSRQMDAETATQVDQAIAEFQKIFGGSKDKTVTA